MTTSDPSLSVAPSAAATQSTLAGSPACGPADAVESANLDIGSPSHAVAPRARGRGLAPALALGLIAALSAPALARTATQTATYRVRFEATWSPATHPGAFPGGAHFSPLVGATHGPGVTFWQPGGLATPGIETMAETGGTGPLNAEVNGAIGAGTAGSLLSGPSLFGLPAATVDTFVIDQDFPLVTLVTMIAPSPDWFVGVHGLELFEDGNWVESKVVELMPYDAGTDSGLNFNSVNADTNPQEPIAVLAGPFAGLPPLGTFTFTRLDTPVDPWGDLGQSLPGTNGAPLFQAQGPLCEGTTLSFELSGARENALTWLAVGFARIDAPFLGGVMVPDVVSPSGILKPFGTDAAGALSLAAVWPAGILSGTELYAQFWTVDPAAPFGYSASNAQGAVTP